MTVWLKKDINKDIVENAKAFSDILSMIMLDEKTGEEDKTYEDYNYAVRDAAEYLLNYMVDQPKPKYIPYTNYKKFDRQESTKLKIMCDQPNEIFNFMNKVSRFKTRSDAEMCLVDLREILDCYGYVRLDDLCDIRGIDTSDIPDLFKRGPIFDYGWRDLSDAKVCFITYPQIDRRIYRIDFPDLEPIF